MRTKLYLAAFYLGSEPDLEAVWYGSWPSSGSSSAASSAKREKTAPLCIGSHGKPAERREREPEPEKRASTGCARCHGSSAGRWADLPPPSRAGAGSPAPPGLQAAATARVRGHRSYVREPQGRRGWAAPSDAELTDCRVCRARGEHRCKRRSGWGAGRSHPVADERGAWRRGAAYCVERTR